LDWAVVHRMRYGGRVVSAPALIITAVPEEVSRASLRSALEAAGHTVSFSEAGVAWANHSLLPRGQWPLEWASEGRPGLLSYERLLAQGTEPHRLTVALPAQLWALATLTARGRDLALSAWVAELINANVAGPSPAPGSPGPRSRPTARARPRAIKAGGVRPEGGGEGDGDGQPLVGTGTGGQAAPPLPAPAPATAPPARRARGAGKASGAGPAAPAPAKRGARGKGAQGSGPGTGKSKGAAKG